MDVREASGLDSSEHSGMMVGPNCYGGGVPGHSMFMGNPSGLMPSGLGFPFNTMPSPAPKLFDSPGLMYSGDGLPRMRPEGVFSMGEPMKKKRGRPRKYGPDGSMSLALCSTTTSTSECNTNNASMSESTAKRRGRPPGSRKKQQLDALGSSGTSFTPHVITVKAGEDVASKIMAFSQQGPRAVCILSANGAICNVTLRQPSTSGGTVTYEKPLQGRFEIISLSGSFLLTENGGARSRTGGLSVALAGSDGRVHGGGVAGMLMAATSVQVVVGSFLAEKKKPKSDLSGHEPSSAPPQQIPGFGPQTASSPPSQVSLSDSGDEQRKSPMDHDSGHENNFDFQFRGLPSYSVGWAPSRN
ncbi:hypothetical protein KSP39_PZI014782 [Platanthera zijinensis]|uniref:AT-hook motif nuclear-localized protein n=1 Tax=Platanthera zijinensis TaxID=2320716 RepID=A0AAP0BAE6_9ASPA